MSTAQPQPADEQADREQAALLDRLAADPPGDDGDEPDGPYDADDAEDTTCTGRCHDGPWDGRTVTVRYPGFLLIDRPNERCWIYDREPSGDFHARTTGGALLDHAGRWKAALEPFYDIRVVGDHDDDLPPDGGVR